MLVEGIFSDGKLTLCLGYINNKVSNKQVLNSVLKNIFNLIIILYSHHKQAARRRRTQMTTPKIVFLSSTIFFSFAMQSCGVAPRTLGTYIEDHSIVSQAEKIISKSKHIKKDFSVQAHAFNEILLLTGEVAQEKTRMDLFDTMTNIPKVRQIQNEISIRDPISFRTKISDSFIKSKIKSKIIFKNIVKQREVKIICRNGTVYLMGLVSSVKNAKLTRIAQGTRGVQSVVVLLETTQ